MGDYRSPVALSEAITRETRFRLRLAMVLGAGAAIMASLLTGGLAPDAPASLAAASIPGLAFAAVSIPAFALPHLTARQRHRALEVAYWAAIRSARRSAELTGERRIPATPAQAVAWLARQPDTDAARHLRVFCQLVVGDIPAARALAARMADGTPIDRYRRTASVELIRFVEGGAPDVAALRRMRDELDTDEERLGVDTDSSMLEALAAAADGRDWAPALTNVRARVGAAADGVLLRPFWIPIIVLLAAAAVLLALGTYAIRSVLA